MEGMISGVDPGKLEQFKEQIKKLGTLIADKQVDKMLDIAESLCEATGQFEYDEIKSSDLFMEVSLELTDAFLEGMSDAWPHPIGYKEE